MPRASYSIPCRLKAPWRRRELGFVSACAQCLAEQSLLERIAAMRCRGPADYAFSECGVGIAKRANSQFALTLTWARRCAPLSTRHLPCRAMNALPRNKDPT